MRKTYKRWNVARWLILVQYYYSQYFLFIFRITIHLISSPMFFRNTQKFIHGYNVSIPLLHIVKPGGHKEMSSILADQ
jgi:hypothetical protein